MEHIYQYVLMRDHLPGLPYDGPDRWNIGRFEEMDRCTVDHILTPEEERKLYDLWHHTFNSPRFEIPTPRPRPGSMEYDVHGRPRPAPPWGTPAWDRYFEEALRGPIIKDPSEWKAFIDST